MTHRLFIGICPPAHIRGALIDLIGGAENVRWQRDDQLHLTLRYIGNVDIHCANALSEKLNRIDCAPFPLTISGTGIFERKGHPHTLWAGIANCAELLRLQRKIERVCVAAGLEPEHRKFHPHITLARLNRATGPLGPFLARTAGLQLGPWQVGSYILYESTLDPEGSIYEPVVHYPLEPNP